MADSNTKKRGRKKISEGGKASPRQIYCNCGAVVKGKLVLEPVHCESGDKDTPDQDIIDEAKLIFNEKHGQDPEKVLGPYFQRKGVNVSKRRDTMNLSLENESLVPGKLGTAVYKGWNVSVRYIDGHDDAVYIIYKTHTKEDKKTKPANKVVRLAALENLEDAEA